MGIGALRRHANRHDPKPQEQAIPVAGSPEFESFLEGKLKDPAFAKAFNEEKEKAEKEAKAKAKAEKAAAKAAEKQEEQKPE